jgi:hypothetical protein
VKENQTPYTSFDAAIFVTSAHKVATPPKLDVVAPPRVAHHLAPPDGEQMGFKHARILG